MLSKNVTTAGKIFLGIFYDCAKTFYGIGYCWWRDGVELFRFLLSPYSLKRDLQQCAELVVA
jgi:hypothetical protein